MITLCRICILLALVMFLGDLPWWGTIILLWLLMFTTTNRMRQRLWMLGGHIRTNNNLRAFIGIVVVVASFVILAMNYGPSIYEKRDFGYGAQRAYEIHKNGLPKTFTPVDFTPPKPSAQELRLQEHGSWLWSRWRRIALAIFLYACLSMREEIWRSGERTIAWARERREAYEDLPDATKTRLGESIPSFFSIRAWWHDLGREIVWDPIWGFIKSRIFGRG